MDIVGNGHILCVLGNLNGWTGDRVRTIMEGGWWSSVLKGGCMWVTNTLNTSLHIYTRVARGQDGVEIEHDRSGAGEERCAASCVGCEGTKRNGTRTFSSTCTV